MKPTIRHMILSLLFLTAVSVPAQEHQVVVQASECAAPQTYSLPDGASLILTATAADNSHFTQWSDGNTNNPRTVTVTGDVSFTALFATDEETPSSDKYTATIYAGECTAPFVGEFAKGSLLQIVAEPKEGYRFKQWSDGNTDNPRALVISSDIELRAEFEEYVSHETLYSVTVDADGCGNPFSRQFYGGTRLVLQADPKDGHIFSRWSDGNTDNPRNVTVTSDMAYTAEFTPMSYTVTFKNEDGTVLDSRKWDYGTVPSCTEPTKPANPQYTYTFAGWSDGTQTYGIDDELPAVTADATYTARYEMKPVVAIEDVELYDNLTAADYAAMLEEYKDRDVNIILMRSFKAGQWNAISLPFELETLEHTPLDGIVYEVTTATTDNINGLTLNFVGTSTMHLCYPYLIKPTKEMVNPRFEKVRLVSFDAQTVVAEGEDVEFRAIMNPVHLKTRTSIVLINNRLYYPRQTSGTNIRAFRAYFEILHPEKIDYVSARLKIEDSITDIPVIEGVEDEYHHTQTSSFKIFHNGILYILMPDGRMYDMQGAEVR